MSGTGDRDRAVPVAEYALLYAFPSGVAEGADGKRALNWPAGRGPFDGAHTVPGVDALNTIQARKRALDASACARVIALGEASARSDARVELGEDALRVGHIAWLQPGPETAWLYHTLGALFAEANSGYGFHLEGMVDPIQFTLYGAGQHFDWHLDLGPGSTATRKLSLTIQLSAGEDYEGGELQFLNAPGMPVPRSLGAATFFPSYLAHRVTPVTRGMRRSLVAWACGPSFR